VVRAKHPDLPAVFAILAAGVPTFAEDVIRIGVDRVMSGAAASRGRVDRYGVETTAARRSSE